MRAAGRQPGRQIATAEAYLRSAEAKLVAHGTSTLSILYDQPPAGGAPTTVHIIRLISVNGSGFDFGGAEHGHEFRHVRRLHVVIERGFVVPAFDDEQPVRAERSTA